MSAFAADVAMGLSTQWLGHAHLHHASIGSTNDDAAAWGEDGAPHGAEVLYVFANLGADALPEDIKVSDLMQRYWINFASTGDPNGPGLPHWPAFNREAKTAMIFEQTPTARPLPQADRIASFDRLLACVNK